MTVFNTADLQNFTLTYASMPSLILGLQPQFQHIATKPAQHVHTKYELPYKSDKYLTHTHTHINTNTQIISPYLNCIDSLICFGK
jgi:hypothetical protein